MANPRLGASAVKPVVVFGNVNDDTTLCYGEPYHDSDLFGPSQAISLIGGKLSIRDQGHLSVPYEGKRIIYPLRPGIFEPGEKVTTLDPIIAETDTDSAYLPISRGQSAWPLPGGGGTNIGRGLYRVFRSLSRKIMATCSHAQLAGFETKLRSVWGGSDKVILFPLNIPIGVNVVLEGLGTYLDRNIFRAPQQSDTTTDRDWQTVDPNAICMVNTIYNWQIAVCSLIEATLAAGCVIACTESLCSKKAIPEPLATELAQYATERLSLDPPLISIQSIHHFLKEIVLSHEWANKIPPVWIFNETEFGHFIDLPVWMETEDHRKYIQTARILEGLIRFREIEKSQGRLTHSVVFITCGKLGAFAFDQHDNLHFCDTLTLNERVKEKNAIGDLFASTILGVLAGGVIEKSLALPCPTLPGSSDSPLAPDQLWVVYSLLAASATADSGVYDGFRQVSVAAVNSRLALKANNYYYLGDVRKLRERFLAHDMVLESFVRNMIPKLKLAGLEEGKMPSLASLVEERILTSTIS